VTPRAPHGASTRRPVYSGNRRVPGLWQRDRADGTTAFEFAGRLAGGKSTHRTLSSRTKTDAIAELRTLQVDAERGDWHRSLTASPTVAEVAQEWLAQLESRIGLRDRRRRYSPRTVRLYKQRVRSHIVPALGHLLITEPTVRHVRRFVAELEQKRRADGERLGGSVVNGTINNLSAIFEFAKRDGLVERNPVRDLNRDDRPGTKRQSEPRWITETEFHMLASELTHTFRPVAATCLYANARISEALGLIWGDIDFTAQTITIRAQLGEDGDRMPTKTEASIATLPLFDALARELREHRSRQASRDLRLVHSDHLVFTTRKGGPQSRRNAHRAIVRAAAKAGLNGDGREPVGPHDLRDSFVGIAFAQGLSPVEVAALARHANPRVTLQLYAGLADGGREQAAMTLREQGFGT
jgi:integrase